MKKEKREALRQLIAESQYDITHGQETTPKTPIISLAYGRDDITITENPRQRPNTGSNQVKTLEKLTENDKR